jgi:hypothetical protein
MSLSSFKEVNSHGYDEDDGYLGTVDQLNDLQELKKIYNKFKNKDKLYFHAYKYVYKTTFGSPIKFPRLVYKLHSVVEIPRKDCNSNPKVDCGAGINVASNWWCIRAAQGCFGKIYKDYRIIQLDVYVKDIVCIPDGTDGKFRVCKAQVTRIAQ